MENFGYILSYMAIGAILRRSGLFPDNTPIVLNLYVLYVALPALILETLPGVALSVDLLVPVVTPWVLLGLMVSLILFLARRFNWSREVTGALLIVVPLGNTSFLGFPMVVTFFGQAGMPYAVMYDQLGSFFALVVYASVVSAIYSPTAGSPTVRSVTRQILTFPAFIALAMGLSLRDTDFPPFAVTLLDSLSGTLVPVVMVAVGYQLTLTFRRDELAPLSIALGLKLAVMPLLAALGWMAMGQSGLAVSVSIFQAAMPSMISAGAISIMAGLAPRLVSGIVGMGILLSLGTLPLVYWLLEV